MKNRLKNGFTLVELLVTIVLLGVVGAIVIYNMTSVTSNSKESEYDRFIATVKSAAQVYADNNPDAFNSLYSNRAFVYFTVEDLIKNGLLDETLINPYTEERIGPKEQIKANLDTAEGGLFFEYPISSETQKETFMVAMSDYVQWGEPYDCFQGAGTYQFSLSTEAGELIPINKENIDKYEIKCSFPEDAFVKEDVVMTDDTVVNGWRSEKPGTYDITYTWVTESGTRKSAKRTLRVLPKVVPTFTTAVGNGTDLTPYAYALDSENTPVYEPTYDPATGKWKALYIKPLIDGGSDSNVTYTVWKKVIKPKEGQYGDPIVEDSNEFNALAVDDGLNMYKIKTMVYGHHYKNYAYDATEEYKIHQELVIPTPLVSGASTAWATSRSYSISDIYSPIGVLQYEYYISNDSAPKNLASLAVESSHTFPYKTSKSNVTINAANSCTNALNEYKYVFFRAINKNGYVGKWTPVTNAYITNHLAKLVQTDSTGCSTCGKCCTKSGSNCYYCGKAKYVNFDNKNFILLEKYSNNQILAAYNGVSAGRVTPTSIRSGSYTVQTCDGSYTVNYWYNTASHQNLVYEINSFSRTLPANYQRYLMPKSWTGTGYGYVGTVDLAMFNRYGAALHDPNPYWTSTKYSGGFSVAVNRPYNHGDYSSRDSTYFYAISGGAVSQAYAGSSAYVKPIVQFRENIYVCGGSGASTSPYVVATK